jgi:integrative and conjugative element protein (TIGR02256 family)
MKSPIEPIWLPRKLHDAMRELATRAYPSETGGVLMGFDAGNGLVVTELIGPGPRAIHERHTFTPDYQYQDAEIKRIYTDSRRLHTYLGDWHSHPDGSASLSPKDKRALRVIAAHKAARAKAPVMAILAGATSWKLAVWRCVPRSVLQRRYFHRYDKMTLVLTGRLVDGKVAIGSRR